MLQVVDAGGQAALLAPTEVLAAQHYRSMRDLLGPLGRAGELDGAEQATRVALVTGSLRRGGPPAGAGRRSPPARPASCVGTHALLYEGVDFADLGLVVVDEQHRFGVEQRDALRAKADQPPHVLVMTATPIPRTVAMTVFGDLEMSTLRRAAARPVADRLARGAGGREAGLPRPGLAAAARGGRGRAPGVRGLPADRRRRGDRGRRRRADGRRRTRPAGRRWRCSRWRPLLAEGPLHGLRVGVLHGRLPADEKDAVMRAFAAGELDVLVATTVIEVGVDVPNATVMVVLDADRFGVSQLHQLRGRVGRGSAAGLCLLVTEAPAGAPARERLDAVASTLDGFQLAELDLELRREGDVLGEAQSGRRSHLRLLSLLHDADVIDAGARGGPSSPTTRSSPHRPGRGDRAGRRGPRRVPGKG